VYLHQQYTEKSKIYHKVLFDCFCRRTVSLPIEVVLVRRRKDASDGAGEGDTLTIQSTVAQLHSFAFLEQYKIYAYLADHKRAVQLHMSEAYKKRNLDKKLQGTHKRKRLNAVGDTHSGETFSAKIKSLQQL
jgi:hypothetical protein